MTAIAPALRPAPGIRADQQVVVAELADNYAGSHTLPMAEAVVAAVARDGARRVTVASGGGYGLAVAHAAWRNGLRATVVQPARWPGEHGEAARAFGAEVVDADGGYEDAIADSRRRAGASGIADGNLDGPYHDVALRALTVALVRAVGQLAEPPTAVWVPTGGGLTAVAAAAALDARGWPSPLFAVTASGANAILASWPNSYRDLPRSAVTATRVNRPLARWSAAHGRAALTAVHLRHGRVYGVSDRSLRAAADRLAAANVLASPAGAAGLAGLQATPDADPGTHLVLVTSRPAVAA
ncbi:pyridoxal-phosphate dependent enzyme [Dactylosporangium sp. CA-092794]|uniref:pyridoxal-phosphate dependent enzyme n=1 Tax=Dactylosporangium sp. CA-092794 TaxID=3239929 RepID=UPI003D90660B